MLFVAPSSDEQSEKTRSYGDNIALARDQYRQSISRNIQHFGLETETTQHICLHEAISVIEQNVQFSTICILATFLQPAFTPGQVPTLEDVEIFLVIELEVSLLY